MDTMFQTLLTWQFLLLCLTVSGIMFVIKQTSDFIFKKYKFKKIVPFWEQVLLPVLPIVVGGLLTIVAPSYPFPETLKDHGSKIFFGIVAGMLSGLVYRVLKSILLSNIKGTDDPDDTIAKSVKNMLTNNKPNNQ